MSNTDFGRDSSRLDGVVRLARLAANGMTRLGVTTEADLAQPLFVYARLSSAASCTSPLNRFSAEPAETGCNPSARQVARAATISSSEGSLPAIANGNRKLWTAERISICCKYRSKSIARQFLAFVSRHRGKGVPQ